MSGKIVRMLQASTLLAVVFMLFAGAGEAQSLGELSRQQRAKKASKTTKEYTNDDIPAATLAAAAGAEAAKPAEGQAAGEAPKDAAAGEKKPEEVEKEFREKATKLKENVANEERRLDVLQRELNLTQQQYYTDPNVALREQYSREDINKRTAEIEAARQLVEKAKQAIVDLEDELKKKNLPAGWAR